MTNTAAQRCGHCGAWLLPADAVHYPRRRGETDAGNPLLGTVVDGKYRLQAVLGRGGLGTVFQAMHIGSLMHVALKLLHPRFAERPEYRRALLPEARRAATVTHVRCARLLDVGEAEDGAAYLAMELVEGDTLDSLMREGRLAPSHAVDVLMQIAEALEAIHAAGLVHCDLSPRNVMVATRNGEVRVKVLDFGIARTVTLAGAEKARAGEFAGFVNPVFSAPELLAGDDVDARADVYSFGSLAWLLLTGNPPVDDADSRRAALAVAAGELRPWPAVPGVPRRLQRLVEASVRHDRDERPPSAAALRHELMVVRGSRRPAMARSAVVAFAVAVMANLAGIGDAAVPFLRPWAGSALELSDLASPAAAVVQHVPGSRLALLGFHFGGFAPARLRVDVSREGVALLRSPLRPEVDAAGGTLTLSSAQPQWREVIEGLAQSCRDGPVDLSFVVPGRAPLGTARVHVDDEPPELEWRLEDVEGGVLTGSARLSYRCADVVGVESLAADVALRDGRRLHLPLPAGHGSFDLGAAIRAVVPSVEPLGPGELAVVARDRAGNTTRSEPVSFVEADVQAPEVVEVTGPAGEAFLPLVGEVVRMRVRLSQGEAGSRLILCGVDLIEFARLPLSGTALAQTVEVPLATPHGPLASGPLWFVVEDAFGNRSQRQFPVVLRDRSVRLDFAGSGLGARWLGHEIVVGDAGGEVVATVGPPYRVVRADLELSTAAGVPRAGTALEREGQDHVKIRFAALPPGSHVLRLELEEDGVEQGPGLLRRVPVRVLPAAIEVRVPKAQSRFLPGLLQAGVLARRVAGLGEGPGWRVDPALLAYVRGTLWVGAESLVPLSLPERASPMDALLPEIVPVPGHNVLAVDLHDVLDRPVRVLVGDGPPLRREHAGRMLDVVADFWWHEGAPEPIGEELLVEYGQPARLRLRFPLPFLPGELGELRLGIAQGEIAAVQLSPADSGTNVSFELPFAVWSVATQLAGRGREEFAEQIERRLDAYVLSPAGRHNLALRVRTTRSTLQPVTTAELGDVPAGLRTIRLLPVLAPAGPFEEPVPAVAPPRAMFRPQAAVAVRNVTDFLLQDREFCCGEARALVALLESGRLEAPQGQLVHHDDPLGGERLRAGALLPAGAATAPTAAPLVGVDFYQAYTLCRLLGLAVGGDAGLFRLPLGCELELAAYAGAKFPACHAVAATGGSVSMAKFTAAAGRLAIGRAATAAESLEAGDVVPTAFGIDFVGLDFGVREWVGDLPHVPGAELLLREWIGDHSVHLLRVSSFASGEALPPPDLAPPLRTLGVVRGLALGELAGLVGAHGAPLSPDALRVVPDTVPGVLRTEQICRDGRDMLGAQRDARLQRVGFRVAGTAALLARLRGRR